MTILTTTTGSPHTAILGVGAYRPVRLVPNADVVDAIATTPVGRMDRPQSDVVIEGIAIEKVDS